MNQIKCAKCSFLNDSEMNFCTSCGNELVSVGQSNIPTVQKNLAEFETVVRENQILKKRNNSKLWIGGLLGCFGLIVLLFIGSGVVGLLAALQKSYSVANANQNSNKPRPTPIISSKQTPIESNKKIESATPDIPVVTPNIPDKDNSNELMNILNERPEVGKFKQLKPQVVDLKDFFPYANAAAQTSFHDGSKYVSLAIAKFDDFDKAKKNFDEQFSNVKKKGGKTQILETSVDGTINGVYQVKNIYTAEYCTKSAFCYRMVSKDPKSLKYFIENFVKF